MPAANVGYRGSSRGVQAPVEKGQCPHAPLTVIAPRIFLDQCRGKIKLGGPVEREAAIADVPARCKTVAMATICRFGGTVMAQTTPMQPEVTMVCSNAHNPNVHETEIERQLRMRPVQAITTTSSQVPRFVSTFGQFPQQSTHLVLTGPLGTFKSS